MNAVSQETPKKEGFMPDPTHIQIGGELFKLNPADIVPGNPTQMVIAGKAYDLLPANQAPPTTDDATTPEIPPQYKLSWPGLGPQIRVLRHSIGWSQEALAKDLGVSWMTVHRWERSMRAVRFGHFERICELAKVRVMDYMPEISRVPA